MTQALYADSELELVNRLRNLFLVARDARRSRHDNWQRNYRLIHNRMATTGIQNWQPSPRSSEIYPTLSNIVAWMMDNNITIDCLPACDPSPAEFYNAMSKLANDLSAVIYTNWIVEDYGAAIKLALWDCATYGLAIFKNLWDGDRADGLGNAVLTRVDPWSFYIDPQATSLSDAQYMVEARRMSLDEIERRYPNARMVIEAGSGADLQIDERPQLNQDQARYPYANAGQIPGSGTFGSIGGSVIGNYGRPTRPKGTNIEKGIVVYEYWLRENEIWYDDFTDVPPSMRPEEQKHVTSRWRVIVMARGEILMDEYAEDLWSHGEHPYERLVFDDVGEFYGIALVDHLAYPQIYINRLLSMVQQNAELIGNPIFVEPSNAGTSRVPIINRPGQRLTISGVAAMQNRPDWLQPPPMPQYILDVIQFWLARIESTSGLSAITKGTTPNQRNAEGVINSIQEAAFVRIRAELSNLETTLERCTRKLCDLIMDNYDQKRVMAIIGPDGKQLAGVFFANHWNIPDEDGELSPMKYVIQVRAGSTAPTSRQSRVAEADKLFAFGVIDDQAVLEAHQYPSIPEILARKYEKQQKGLIGGGVTGAQRQRSQRKQ